MDSQCKTIVWERINSLGKWFPYSAEACHLLEHSLEKNLSSVCLGDVNIQLKPYVVNLKDMVQISESTGTKCQVRRLLFNADTGIAHNVMWQWKGDGPDVWNFYSTEVMNFIEDAFKNQQTFVDLSEHFQNYPYTINFENMLQKNKKTRRHRHISRTIVSPYPVLKLQPGTDMGVVLHGAVGSCHSNGEISDTPNTCSNKLPTKVPLMQKMSNFWNSFMKSSDLDLENDVDSVHVRSSANKKQKSLPEKNSTKKGTAEKNKKKGSSECDFSSEYATVNGKPWEHAWPPSTPDSCLKPVPGIIPLPEKKKGKGRSKSDSQDLNPVPSSPIDVLGVFTEDYSLNESDVNDEEQVCIICYESLLKSSTYDDDASLIKLNLCMHVYHRSCIKAMFDSGPKDNYLQCPTCKTIYGIKQGNQPPGEMVYHVLPYSLPGHPNCKTIRIIYNIPPGIQGPEHPNPGKRYSARGFPRHCYLPDDEIGRKILRLLVKAWERKLIFTIGTSSTTGEQNTVTWNEIHHKTEFGCNRRGHGYPDPNYFENVISELAAQGVTESVYKWYPA